MSVVAGFDLGGTQLKYGLLDDAGRLILKSKAPTPPTIGGLMDLLGRVWPELKAAAPGGIKAAGFGFPGIYNLHERRILQSPNCAELDDFPLYPEIGKVIDVPFLVDNDANMAAYGEWAWGAGRGVPSLVLLTVGTGIGGGIILDGKLWQGSCGYAGEIGHIVVNADGERCKCGIPAIVRKYGALSGRNEAVTAEEIYRRAEAGEKAAIDAYASAGRFIGIALGMLINLLNPGMILLGGGVMTSGELLLRPAVDEARRRSYKASFACCSIRRASLGNDAGTIGAAAWARNNL